MPEIDLYETVRYPGAAYPDSHPDRIAVMAILHGLNPAPVEQCRVLEIGCSEGANLIPMAYAIPQGQFVGFDLSQTPIARGMARTKQLGLTNVQFFQGDLLSVGEELGEFDYIIAHGVYAWVPPTVQEGLLRLCREHLAPQGIAYINYNCLPGSHIRNWLRDLALIAPGGNDAPARLEATLDLMQFIVDSRAPEDPYRKVLEAQIRHWRKRDPNALFHDELSEAFHPVSFSQFVGHAEAHGLRYVSDSALPAATDPSFKPEIATFAAAYAEGDRTKTEQVLDAIRMRTYRESLLCRSENNVLETLNLDRLQQLSFTSSAMASAGESPATRNYALPNGVAMESRHADTIALMDYVIAAFPEAVSVADVRTFLAGRGVALDETFYTQVFRLVIAKMLDLHAWHAPMSRLIGDKPKTSSSGRQEFEDTGRITSLWHHSVTFSDPVLQRCFLLADGTRDRTGLVRDLHAAFPEMDPSALAGNIQAALQVLNSAAVIEAR